MTFHDLYEAYPDFNVDVAREQALLLEHDLIVYQHPLYWSSAPSLLKEWQDLVLEYGFAFGDGGDRLRGKSLLSVTTTGAGAQAYGRDGHFTLHQLLAPFEHTARFCGMRWLPPFVVHGTLQADDSYFREAATAYRDALEGLRDDTLDLDSLRPGQYLNEAVTTAGNAADA